MPRRILATDLQTRCCNCHKTVNVNLEEGESYHEIHCWNCNTLITVQNGYGQNNITVKCGSKPVRYTITWQQEP